MQFTQYAAFSVTLDEAAAAIGATLTGPSYRWDFSDIRAVSLPEGTEIVDRKIYSGTPTTAGTGWTLPLAEYSNLGQRRRTLYIPIEVAAAPPPPEPEPEPEPEPAEDMAPTVAAFLGYPGDAKVLALATAHLAVVTEFVKGYTRDHGFTPGPDAPLRAVIVSCCARNLVNPARLRQESLGSQQVTYATVDGFTLAEQAILNRYRRRSA